MSIFDETDWYWRPYTGGFDVRFHANGTCTIDPNSLMLDKPDESTWTYQNGILTFQGVDYAPTDDGGFCAVEEVDAGPLGSWWTTLYPAVQ